MSDNTKLLVGALVVVGGIVVGFLVGAVAAPQAVPREFEERKPEVPVRQHDEEILRLRRD